MNTIPRTIIISTTSSTAARLARNMHKDDEKHLNEKGVEEEVLNQEGLDPEEKRMDEIVGLVLFVCLCLILLVLTQDLEIFPDTESDLLDTWFCWKTIIKAN